MVVVKIDDDNYEDGDNNGDDEDYKGDANNDLWTDCDCY